MSRRKVFTARFERDEDGYWCVVAQLGAHRSAISDGQTLPKARRRIRQAISLLLEVPEDSFEVREQVVLPAGAESTLARHRTAQARLRSQALTAADTAKRAARALTRLGISRRDAGELLGVSGSRVQQVVSTGPPVRRRRRASSR